MKPSGSMQGVRASRLSRKISDFQERSVLCGSPPKVIWLRIPNSSTSEIAAWIRGALHVTQEFIEDPDQTLLVLNRL
jgi:predicted nuclease of predicted toxin-antitoxin system